MTKPSETEIPLILIVDDDRSMRALLKLAMTEEGYRVAEAKNAEECLIEYHRLQPDMVLLDAVLPEMDGFTCCERLRQLPNNDRLPILMLTVLDTQESVEQAFAAGATDFITKPIHWAVLSQRVKHMLAANQIPLQAEIAMAQLEKQQDWEHLLRKMLQLSQSGRLSEYMDETVSCIRDFLEVDGVLLYRREDVTVIESVRSNAPSVKELSWQELSWKNQEKQGEIIAITDLDRSELPTKLVTQLIQSQIQALLIAPIIIQGYCWGIFGAYSVSSRCWDKSELDKCSDLANLFAIALRVS